MYKKILIANRGEIALRILRACKELSIKTVAIYSVVDKNLKHVLLADEKICIGQSDPIKSYLNIPAIISSAEITGSDAIHPGYGFLSESYDFAKKVKQSGFGFIGPEPKSIKLLGNKISAIKIMKKYGINCIPGINKILNKNIEKIKKITKKIGYPVIAKSSDQGGGKGMQLINNEKELEKIIDINNNKISTKEKRNLYIEKFLDNSRHIEIQILSDGKGNIIFFPERDCTIQRRYQKIIEETPAQLTNKNALKRIVKICKKICLETNYKGVGTFEFLYKNGSYFFIEMNTRIQVEHTISEMVTNIDLIKEQIKTSFGYPLSIKQKDVKVNGYSIECRIYVENQKNFTPNSGKINHLHIPSGFGIRWESHIYSGYSVPHYYDSMIGKLISHSDNREISILKMKQALSELIIDGINTNIELLKKIVNDINFKKNLINTNFIKDFI